jgi:Domain of unknown function (DUF1827).
MKIINVTNNHRDLVKEQLHGTDAEFVEVYSAGNTDVIFTRAPKHYELLISNKHRAVRPDELEEIKKFFINKRVDTDKVFEDKISIIEQPNLIEISVPIDN